MTERLSSTTRVVRVRPVTFAYTRPLTPADASGMTGLLTDAVEVKAPAQPKGTARVLAMFKRFFGAR